MNDKALYELAEQVGYALRDLKLMLATAESCTAGTIVAMLSDIEGCGAFMDCGFVVYSSDSKQRLLDVKPSTIETFNMTSEEVAREMAAGALRNSKANVAVATTGIAGPGGGTEEKPVGTVAIALAAPGEGGAEHLQSQTYRLWGNREWVKILTSQVALDWVRRHLLGLDPLESNFNRRAPRRA